MRKIVMKFKLTPTFRLDFRRRYNSVNFIAMIWHTDGSGVARAAFIY